MLPFRAFLGHNAVYLLAGFLCFCWLKHEEDEEELAGRSAPGLLVAFLPLTHSCSNLPTREVTCCQ
jgi:hypothetical protein